MRTLRPSLLLGVFLFACTAGNGDEPGDDDDDDSGPTPPTQTTPLDATVVLSDTISSVAFVTWTPPAAGESWVEYGLEGTELLSSTPRVASGTEPHEQILLGMKAEHTYEWQAVTEVDGVRNESPIGTVTTGVPPAGVAAIIVTVSDPTKYDPAPYLLTVTLDNTNPATVVIYDREGDPVWYAESPSTVRKMHTARPSWDGKSIVYGYYDQTQDVVLGGIYRVGMDGRSEAFSPTIDGDHDFVERKDGSYAYLHLDSRHDVNVEGAHVDVAAAAIYETREGDDPIVTPPTQIFNQFDDSGQPPYWTCSHMESTEDFEYHQWTHANSLMPDPFDPENFYWVNYRFQDSLLRVDRTSGTIDWEIGGRYDDSDMTPEDAWDHGHMSQFWPGGFLMFDNNTHDEGFSRVRQYSYDQATKHVQMEQEWTGVAKTPGMADARLTHSDTMIVNWVGRGGIQERTRDDEVVWEVQVTGATAGRITLLTDLYDLDDPYPY